MLPSPEGRPPFHSPGLMVRAVWRGHVTASPPGQPAIVPHPHRKRGLQCAVKPVEQYRAEANPSHRKPWFLASASRPHDQRAPPPHEGEARDRLRARPATGEPRVNQGHRNKALPAAGGPAL